MEDSMMKLDVVFVCQSGELEVMSALLAASLRRHCDDQVFIHLIEPVPKQEYGTVSPLTKKFLDGLGVKWYPFRNPISDEYKVFNKLNAFNIQPQGDRILFLDSDVIVRRPLQALRAYFNRPFAAKCGYNQAFSADEEEWKLAYRLFDLPVPKIRWPAADSHQWGPPYFNAAVILVDPQLDFSIHWIEACSRIHHDEAFWAAVKNKSHGTVQIGLPVALHHRAIPYAVLDRRFNFGLSKTRVKRPRAWGDNEAYIVHYGNPRRMIKDGFILYDVNELVKSFKLDEIFAQLPSWLKLLGHLEELNNSAQIHALKPRSSLFVLPVETEMLASAANQDVIEQPPQTFDHATKSRRVFITGIPGAGVSLFSSLLAELPNVVVLNEPDIRDELKSPLENFATTWKTWRAMIDQGGLNPGILPSGELSPGPVKNNQSRRAWPHLRSSSYILAVPYELGCLSCPEEIVKTFPQAMVFILVRNPFATIQSWLASPYLKEAKIVEECESADIAASFLSEEQRQYLAELRGINDPAMKRAGLWSYFADLANVHAKQVHIFRYEDLIENPTAVLKYACEKLFPGLDVKLPDIDLSKLEQESLEELTEWDKECIRAICSNNAGAFGYNLYES